MVKFNFVSIKFTKMKTNDTYFYSVKCFASDFFILVKYESTFYTLYFEKISYVCVWKKYLKRKRFSEN